MASVVRILLKSEGAAAVKSELEKVAKSSEGMAKRLRGGVALAAAGAGTALAAMAVQGIAGARESAQIHRVLESQIRGMGAAAKVAFGGATTFAEDYGKAIGKDDDDILKVINKLSTFPAAFGKGTLGAEGMRRATKAAFDLEAAGVGSAESNIIGLGKAMDNPIKGLTALSKSGVSFTEEQKKQITSYTKAGKLAEAQKVLLKGIESNAKGAATAQADGLTRAKVALEGFAESVASKALPYLDRFGAWFTDVGIPKLEQFGAWISTNVAPKIGPAFETAKTAASGFVSFLSNPAVQAFGATILTVVAGIKTYTAVMTTVKAVTTAFRTAQIALNIAMAANPVGLIILAIAALAVGLVVAYKRSATFRAFVQQLGAAFVAAGQKVAAFVRGAIKWVRDLPGAIKGAFASAKTMLLGAGKDVIQGLWNGLKERFDSAKQWLVDKVNSLPDAVKKVLGINSPSKVFKLIGSGVGEGFALGITAGWNKRGKPAVKALAKSIATEVTAKAKAAAATQKQVLADLIAARKDYAASIAENLRGGGITSLVNLDGVSTSARVDTVVKAYQARLAAVRSFAAGINALGRKGLGRGLLDQLVTAGPDQAGGIVAALRNAAPGVLAQIRSLDAMIAKESATFGSGFAAAAFKGQIGAAQAAATRPLQLVVKPDGSAYSKMLVADLRKAVRAAGGNVQVVLGTRS